MSIESRQNRYRGVNDHLHSAYQHEGGWSGFHSKHIADLAVHIDTQLPAGYEVELEQSLQIHEFHPDTGERVRNPRPDVTVYDAEGKRENGQSAYPTATLTQPINVTFMLNVTAYYTTLRVYHYIGERYPVLQIKLLSPGNKPGGHGAVQYMEKRIGILKAGLRLVEVDYTVLPENFNRYSHDDQARIRKIMKST